MGLAEIRVARWATLKMYEINVRYIQGKTCNETKLQNDGLTALIAFKPTVAPPYGATGRCESTC
jgi:hypothetical protein